MMLGGLCHIPMTILLRSQKLVLRVWNGCPNAMKMDFTLQKLGHSYAIGTL